MGGLDLIGMTCHLRRREDSVSYVGCGDREKGLDSLSM